MAIEGTSSSVGAPPAWLERASDIRTVGFEDHLGKSVLHVKAPTLGDAAPEIFEQGMLWQRVARPNETSLQLIGRVGQAVRKEETGSDLYDKSLLRRLSSWKDLFSREVSGIHIPGSQSDGANVPVMLDIQVVEHARTLSALTPPPRQIRIVGKLEMIRHSTRSFALVLDNGEEVKGVLKEGDPDLLQHYFGRDITVFGKAIYRPSGSLLRVDAYELLDSTEGRAVFSSVPDALGVQLKSPRKLQTPKTGVSAFFGSWPGEESDGELLAALGDLRH
jgi:hypothetical protein